MNDDAKKDAGSAALYARLARLHMELAAARTENATLRGQLAAAQRSRTGGVRAVDLVLAGFNVPAAAAQCEVSESTVRRALRAAGAPRLKPGRPPKSQDPRMAAGTGRISAPPGERLA